MIVRRILFEGKFGGRGCRRSLPAVALVALLAVCLPLFAIPVSDGEPEELPASTPVEKASEKYKAIKELQFSGAADAEYYPAVLAAYGAIVEALDVDTLSQPEKDQCRGMLLDINGTLARGAVFYSMSGNSTEMTKFARAYVDSQLHPGMAGADFRKDQELYPAMVYVAASGSYNSGDIDSAVKYFEEYLATGATKQREQVCLFYGQALLNSKQFSKGVDVVVKASEEYPSNFQLLRIAMQLCIDGNRRDILGPLVSRALEVKPDDEQLLNLQASVYEQEHNYRGALDIYMKLEEKHPNSLSINESVARCYYNLGAGYYNQSISELNEKEVSKLRRQSNAYFSGAADKYEILYANDPGNLKYLKALATSYACLGNTSKVESLNVQLVALGGQSISMTAMPEMIGSGAEGDGGVSRNIPPYQEYAVQYVSEKLKEWLKRGEFEKLEDYEQRVSKENILKEQERLSDEISAKYLQTYANRLVISELELQPYDVDNETYAIESDFGPVYLKVPLKNHEAEIFKSNWNQVQIRNPKFFVKHNNIAIESISFVTPDGKEYAYNVENPAAYEGDKVVKIDLEQILGGQSEQEPVGRPDSRKDTYVITAQSDVDKDIPHNKQTNTHTVALVIANENYKNVMKVSSAYHDGDVFARYCRETLGIPDKQVLFYPDVTYAELLSAINQLKNFVEALGSDVDVIVYYAGHGVPEEGTNNAYIMPVDSDPMVMATAYSLSRFYKDLGDIGASNVMVFMDACFSGANRGDGMLAEARSIVLKAKQAAPSGNMFVLSAADGNETALPYKEKNHGLFTYYLLKKLQDSKGNASLKDITDFVTKEVKLQSVSLNKPQNPKMVVSGTLSTQLSSKKLRR